MSNVHLSHKTVKSLTRVDTLGRIINYSDLNEAPLALLTSPWKLGIYKQRKVIMQPKNKHAWFSFTPNRIWLENSVSHYVTYTFFNIPLSNTIKYLPSFILFLQLSFHCSKSVHRDNRHRQRLQPYFLNARVWLGYIGTQVIPVWRSWSRLR